MNQLNQTDLSCGTKMRRAAGAHIISRYSRELMNLLLNKGAKVCAVFAGNEAEGFRYVIGSRPSCAEACTPNYSVDWNPVPVCNKYIDDPY